jgi:hypothetical protein
VSVIPLVGHFEVKLDAGERSRLDHLARRIMSDDPQIAAYDMFGSTVAPGLETGPSFLFEDHSEAGGFPNRHSPLEYRSLLLADTGDLVAVEGSRNRPFEDYCRDVLELGSPDVVAVPPSLPGRDQRLAQRCLHSPEVMRRLVEIACRTRQLDLIPYLGGGWTWRLAGAVAQETGATVRVAAPPPTLARRANDKLWFAERVAEVLGPQSRPTTYAAFGSAALARRVGLLARRFERVVVKVPTGSGAHGNVVLDAADVEALAPAELERRLVALMRSLGWSDQFPLVVGVWSTPILASPSVQLWIPARADGPPIIEGIFTQLLRPPVGAFIGAEPTTRPGAFTDQLVEEAGRMATLLQALGYFGRCSFDTVLTGSDVTNARVHWIECNPRWSGVSIAITLANRLTGDWTRRPFVVVQRTDEVTLRRGIPDALRRLRGHTFTRAGQSGVVLMSPESIVTGTGINLMVIGSTVESARAEADIAQALLTDDTAR